MPANYVKMPELYDYDQAKTEQQNSLAPKDKDKWGLHNYLLEGAYLGLQLADERQTEQIARNHKYRETNPYLGPHPSEKRVREYMAATALAQLGLAYLLPEPWRTMFQGVSIGIEQDGVRNNLKYGVDVMRW